MNLTLFGVFASVYFIKSGNIWGVGALHSIWNLAQGNIYGIRVSGIVTECSVFASAPSEGGFLLNGAFGLEGGLAVTIVLLAGTCFLLRKRPERAAGGRGAGDRDAGDRSAGAGSGRAGDRDSDSGRAGSMTETLLVIRVYL